MAVVSFPAEKQADYVLLKSALPGMGEETIGVLLLDRASDSLHIRLRRDWAQLASEEDAEVLEAVEEDLQLQAHAAGGRATLERLLTDASNSLRVGDLTAVTVRDFQHSLNDLYRMHVSSTVQPYRTHLPRYSLSVAAGPFLTNSEDIEAEEWVETPEDLKLDDGMFVARIQGQSMEPRIPNGSYCVFRRNVVGSRNGRLVLVRNSELADDNQYTVKRYRSFKTVTEDGFEQNRIRLESLNPASPSWDLDPESDKYQVVAEFVRVLE